MAPATSPILLPLSLILLLLALCSPSPPFLTSLSSRGGSSGGSSAVDTPKSDPSAPSKTTVLETTINRSYDEVVEACLDGIGPKSFQSYHLSVSDTSLSTSPPHPWSTGQRTIDFVHPINSGFPGVKESKIRKVQEFERGGAGFVLTTRSEVKGLPIRFEVCDTLTVTPKGKKMCEAKVECWVEFTGWGGMLRGRVERETVEDEKGWWRGWKEWIEE